MTSSHGHKMARKGIGFDDLNGKRCFGFWGKMKVVQQAQTSEGVPSKAREAIERYSPQDTIEQIIPIFVRGQQEGLFAEGDAYKRLILFLSVVNGLMLQDAKAMGMDWTQEVDRLLNILTK